ncbi:DegV family protein [Metabacillus fastidiosus]|uniref:DegV family protein n=1 Tax=Metabacillus fastidiosus TaxID=1458 RepID=A0ABU6P3C5_9BACI|nr:DegV family protein [Metabacillus fastidiosus]MED4403157.1 DegV family protein [Metabacillus fastidiosus]MED4455391.1 DegV family protein [Metabacillus fastidiosus]MED4461582.1 DegV family protein [Metabacillus fastidiosus]
MNVQIIADSGCDLPLEYYNENSVSFIPLHVQLKENEYEDLIEIQPKTVFDAMREGEVAKTSQASPNHFKELFTRFAEKNIPCVYIAFSSRLSGTYQTAVMIKNEVLEQYPNFQIAIIDSKCASLGHGLAVKHAVKLAAEGKTVTELEETLASYCTKVEHLFTVDNLDYLARGGRISKASAFVGGLLSIKPLLHVEDGQLVPLEKIRGRKKLFRRIIELMKERGEALDKQTIAISHGDDEEAALEIKKMIEDEFSPKEIIVNMIGATIGAHSGPGTIAIFFLNNEA